MLILPFKRFLLGRVWMIRSVESGSPPLLAHSLKMEGYTGHIEGSAFPPQFAWPQRLRSFKGPALKSVQRFQAAAGLLPFCYPTACNGPELAASTAAKPSGWQASCPSGRKMRGSMSGLWTS
jgi:hypothetical protein